MKSQGFSLVELIVVLVLMSILTISVIPSTDNLQTANLWSSAAVVKSDVIRAREHACDSGYHTMVRFNNVQNSMGVYRSGVSLQTFTESPDRWDVNLGVATVPAATDYGFNDTLGDTVTDWDGGTDFTTLGKPKMFFNPTGTTGQTGMHHNPYRRNLIRKFGQGELFGITSFQPSFGDGSDFLLFNEWCTPLQDSDGSFGLWGALCETNGCQGGSTKANYVRLEGNDTEYVYLVVEPYTGFVFLSENEFGWED